MTFSQAYKLYRLNRRASHLRQIVQEHDRTATFYRENGHELGGWRCHVMGVARTRLRLAEREIAGHLEKIRKGATP